MSKHDALNSFLNPQSVAIIGVSKDLSTISGKPLKNLIRHQYKGSIFLVNPKYNEIEGITCYPNILDIPGKVDLALVAVSSSRILQILEDCEKKQIRHLILFGSGFAEIGEEGKELQEKVLEKAKKAGIQILGPNCIGLLNVKERITLGFSTSFETESGFISGNVGFASQSGAAGFSLFGLAQDEHIGFSYIINTGNEIDIHTLDCIEYMLHDVETTVIAGYLEGIPDGDKLIEISESSNRLKKPIILLKAGRSEIGRKAALSHTASLTGSNETFQAVAKQYGIITVNDIDDMIDALKIFSRGKSARGNRVATISNSGAAGIAMADFCEMLGLNMVRLSSKTEEKIKAIIPTYGSALNPIDITAQALNEQHIFMDTLEVLINDDDVDVIVIHTTFGGKLGKKICESIAKIDKQTEKPIIVTVTGSSELTGEEKKVLQLEGVPVYNTSYRTMLAIKYLVDFSLFCMKKEAVKEQLMIGDLSEEMQGIWTEVQVKEALSEMGITVPQGILVKNSSHLEAVKDQIQYPVVAKIISSDVLHKTDAGGVKVNIQNATELETAFENILQSVKQYLPNASIEGILIEEMFQGDKVEMFIGVKEDPQFGPLIVCGLGGIFIEVLKDVSIRRAPIQIYEAEEMLKELKGYPLLQGVRGENRKDISALSKALVQISLFAAQNKGKIQEMDINPVWVLDESKGIVALDGIIVWKENIDAHEIVNNR